MIDFDNPPLVSEEVARTFKVDELGGQCNKIQGVWCCAAYVDRGNVRTIVAMKHGKKAKPTLRDCMTTAIKRIEDYRNVQSLSAVNNVTINGDCDDAETMVEISIAGISREM